MKALSTLMALLLISLVGFSQTNETPMNYYTWKGKKTVLADGFVVLKSGKKMEGQISLKGSINAVEAVLFIGEGNEFELPVAALNSYGLNVEVAPVTVVQSSNGTTTKSVGPINESDEGMYQWRYIGEVNGTPKHNTKPRQGYIVMTNGTLLEGELQLKKANDNLNEFEIKTSNGKEKLKTWEVAKYGLLLTIDELTNDGKKTFRQTGKNFYNGTIVTSGVTKQGYIGFAKDEMTPSGRVYSGVLFTENRNDVLRSFSDVSAVTQTVDGQTINYAPFGDGFLSDNPDDTPKADKDATRVFSAGTITLSNGSVKNGEVAQIKKKFYATSINFKDESGTITSYGADELNNFTQEINGIPVEHMKIKSAFVAKEFDGGTFMLYHNPYPTTVNEGATKRALSAASMAASAASTELAKTAAGDDELGKENMAQIRALSTDSLTLLRDYIFALSEDEQYNDVPDEIKQRYAALAGSVQLELSRREIGQSDMKIFYDEWILVNKKDNSKTILYKQDYKDIMEPVLMGCFTYLTMEKGDQKEFLDMDNIMETVEMLDGCY